MDPTTQYPLEEWPFRTTFALDDRSTWTMLEFCEDLRTMQDHAAAVEPGWKRIIAILTNEVIPTEQMGFVAEDIMQTDEVSGSSSHGSRGQVDVAQQTAAQRHLSCFRGKSW